MRRDIGTGTDVDGNILGMHDIVWQIASDMKTK